jgi:hypothetical protein
MQYTNEYDYLIGKLTEQEDVVAHHLVNGKVYDIEEYKKLCGFVEGLRYAKEIIKDLQTRQEQDADE